VTIADDEPRIYLGGVTAYEGDSGTSSLAIDVTLGLPYHDWDPYHFWDPYNESYSNAYDEAVTVSFASQDGTAVAGLDYLATSGTLTFAPGETTKWIDLAIYGDRLVEGSENFFVNLSGAPNAVIASGHHSITLVDNEPAIGILDGIISGEATFTFTFNIYLSNWYDEPVTVHFATADGTAIAGVDYVATSGTLTFAPGEYFKAITVQILLIDLTTDMPEKYFYVRLSDHSTNASIADEWAVGQFAGETVYYSTGDY
jgi:hypothetical protein